MPVHRMARHGAAHRDLLFSCGRRNSDKRQWKFMFSWVIVFAVIGI